MSAFIRYSNFFNSGEKLPPNTVLNFAILISEGRSASRETCEVLFQWAKDQSGWDTKVFLNAFCKSYSTSKKTDGLMDLLECAQAHFDKQATKEILNAIIFNCLTSFVKTSKISVKTLELIVDLYLHGIFDFETYFQILTEISKCPMSDSRRTSMMKALTPKEVIEKLDDAGSSTSILLILKSIVATKDEAHENVAKTLKILVKCGLFTEDQMNLDKELNYTDLVLNWCLKKIDLETCLKNMRALNISNDHDAVFLGYIIFKFAIIDSNHQGSLAILVKRLNDDVYKGNPLFMKIIMEDFEQNISENNLNGLSRRTFDSIFLLLCFIANLFMVDAVEEEMVINCLKRLHKPESAAEMRLKDPLYPNYKKTCYVTMFGIVRVKLDESKRDWFTQNSHDFSVEQMDALSKKLEEEKQKTAENQENSDEVQEAASKSNNSKKSKKRSKKNRKNSENSKKTVFSFNINNDAEDIEKLKIIVAFLNNAAKLEAFIKALLQQPSTNPKNISLLTKLIENLNLIYAESPATSSIDFASILTSVLDQLFTATKESRLDEATKAQTTRLAIIYAEAYKLKLVSNTKFTAFLHQKRLKELNVDTLAAMSASVGVRMLLDPSVKVQKAAEHLENMLKAAEQTNLNCIHKHLDEVTALFDDLF